jgi:Tfp pilus assembly protein PilN
MRAVNLIPSEQRSGGSVGAGRSGGAAYAVLALLLGFAVLAVAYGKAARTVSNDESEAATLTAKAQQEKAAAEALAPYTSFVSLRQQREQTVTALVDTRFDWAHSFHELGRVLGSQATITALSGQVGTATPSSAPATPPPAGSASSTAAVASATPAGSIPSFTISGCATSQKAVAQMLQRLRLIDGVSEVTLQSSTKGPSNGSGGGATGPCPVTAPVFAVTITFEPLPSASEAATASQTSTVANKAAATQTPTPTPTSTGGGAR